MKFFFIFLFVACSIYSFAQGQKDNSRKQESTTEKNENPPDEIIPEYPGGTKELYEFIAKNLVYPKPAVSASIQGTVTLKFVIEKDGSVGEVIVVDSIGYGCDEEAERLLRAAGNWNPGMQEGKPVRVWFLLPIKFILMSEKELRKHRRQARSKAVGNLF